MYYMGYRRAIIRSPIQKERNLRRKENRQKEKSRQLLCKLCDDTIEKDTAHNNSLGFSPPN